MERLTERFENGQAAVLGCGNNCKYDYKYCNNYLEDCPTITEIYEKLAAYEDAEEQGLLLRLPCKVGDTVWVVTSPFNVFDDVEYDENMQNEVYEAFVSSVTFYYKCGKQYRISAKVTNHFIGVYFQECDFGKKVFLTKEEAEAKLKEMEGSHDD